jgi:hypothetical protein
LESALKIVLEGEKPFDAELITLGIAMDISEDFQAKAAAALNSSPALSYATLPPKRKSKGKGKAKPKSMLVAFPGGPDNAIIITDSAPPPVPTNPGPPLWLTPSRLNPKAPPGLPPPVNKAPIKALAYPPKKAAENPAAKQFKTFVKVAKSHAANTGTRTNPLIVSSPSPVEAQQIFELARIYGNLSSDRILTMHRAMASNGRPHTPTPTPPSQIHSGPGRIKMTTRGPLCRQVMISFLAGFHTGDIFSFHLMNVINHGLEQNKSKLRIEAITGASRVSGFTLITIGVANTCDLEILKLYIGHALNTTQNFDLGIPQSKSYLKIVHVLYFMNNAPITPELVGEVMKCHELAENFVLASPPRITRNTKDSDSCTVWFNLWDLQNGKRAVPLVNRWINIGGWTSTIRATSMHPGMPQCHNCWCWGHPTHKCYTHVLCCPKCGGAHCLENHRSHGSCCKAHPKMNPPREATAVREPCTHTFKCLNCKGDHQADDYKCPYFQSRFDRLAQMQGH